MPNEYVKSIEGVYRVGETRVSLDSLVYLFREGMSVESMVGSYPALSLEQVHGALAFYLANQEEIDAYLVEGQRAAESQADECAIDREAAACAQCESDSRLTPISMGAKSEACGVSRRRLISEQQRMPDSLG